jgi:hypothetical protein
MGNSTDPLGKLGKAGEVGHGVHPTDAPSP